jgi:hypothetical protein
MINTCGECKHYKKCTDQKYGVCDADVGVVYENDGVCHTFERRLTMEKQPTENITIPMWRYDLLVKAETMLELAKQIHRNSDEYEAKKNLMIVFDAEKEPCETI